MAEEFDLIVIGSGSGNSLLGPEFSKQKVALLDASAHFGGTCLNYGCIPTKMLVRPAHVIHETQKAKRLGLEFSPPRYSWREIRDRVFGITDKISEAGLRYRVEDCPNITVYRDRFSFVDKSTLKAEGGRVIHGKKIVIAAGSRPRQLDPDSVEADLKDPAIYDSAEFMRLEELPESLVILGGGVIAVEFASMFSSYGLKVTTVNRSKNLLSGMDADISQSFTDQVSWNHMGGRVPKKIVRRGKNLEITLDNGANLLSEAVLVARGRTPNQDVLGCKNVGFDTHPDGRIRVDEHQRVLSGNRPLDYVYALGDVSDPYQLKHVANYQARVVAHNLLHPHLLHKSSLWPVVGAVFSDPQVAWVGLSLATARERTLQAISVQHSFSDTAYGWSLKLKPEEAFVKLVVDVTNGELLGAQIIGPEASSLIQPLIQTASLRIDVRGLARAQYWPHPAATEVIENALLKAETELAAL